MVSVNKFGTSSNQTTESSIDQKYVDQKFVTLSNNLATKVDKAGDTMPGDLYFSLGNDNERSFGVTDSSPGKSVVLFLGDVDNKIVSNYNNALQIEYKHGVKIIGPTGDVCWLKEKEGPQFYKSINMNRNTIHGLSDPYWEEDAATKNYVDTRFVKNSVGFVPILTTNLGKNGFVVSESSFQSTQNMGFQVFNRSNQDWIVADSEKTNCWIKLKCPEQIRIYKFVLRGRSGNPAKHSFKLEGSNDDDNWTDIFSANDVLLDNTVSFFNVLNIDAPTSYCYYRVYITDTEMIKAPGLSYWQIYTLDPIECYCT